MEQFDVVIVGGSFSGLTLAHHLPEHYKVLVVEAKPAAGATVESTGLITEHTRKEFLSFFDVNAHITNKITAIGVVAPSFDDFFFSYTKDPWIYQTDTRGLMKDLAEKLPSHVTLRTSTVCTGAEGAGRGAHTVHTVHLMHMGKKYSVGCRFLVGADGGHSKVAASVPGLDRNKKFLFGYEQVFFGEVHLGPCPEETIYHFWFGEFSLGYGGWLSPTVVNGRKAFRIGLAKLMKDRGDALELMKKFTKLLLERGTITIEGDPTKPDYIFGSHIPIGGMLKNIHRGNVLLVGDAAGFCGAFAADGIKGSVISGKEGAKVIGEYLQGDHQALEILKPRMNEHNTLLNYYKKQLRYRMIWDMMKRNRTFTAMYGVIEAEKDHFLEQFCDSKDKRRSLAWTVLKFKHVPKLAVYSWFILMDLLRG